jgi:hypothetical protein
LAHCTNRDFSTCRLCAGADLVALFALKGIEAFHLSAPNGRCAWHTDFLSSPGTSLSLSFQIPGPLPSLEPLSFSLEGTERLSLKLCTLEEGLASHCTASHLNLEGFRLWDEELQLEPRRRTSFQTPHPCQCSFSLRVCNPSKCGDIKDLSLFLAQWSAGGPLTEKCTHTLPPAHGHGSSTLDNDDQLSPEEFELPATLLLSARRPRTVASPTSSALKAVCQGQRCCRHTEVLPLICSGIHSSLANLLLLS